MVPDFTKEDLIQQFTQLRNCFTELQKEVKRLADGRSVLDGEMLLSNRDLCRMLDVRERTLLRYRQRGLLHGIAIERRVYYRISEVRRFIKHFYNKTKSVNI